MKRDENKEKIANGQKKSTEFMNSFTKKVCFICLYSEKENLKKDKLVADDSVMNAKEQVKKWTDLWIAKGATLSSYQTEFIKGKLASTTLALEKAQQQQASLTELYNTKEEQYHKIRHNAQVIVDVINKAYKYDEQLGQVILRDIPRDIPQGESLQAWLDDRERAIQYLSGDVDLHSSLLSGMQLDKRYLLDKQVGVPEERLELLLRERYVHEKNKRYSRNVRTYNTPTQPPKNTEAEKEAAQKQAGITGTNRRIIARANATLQGANTTSLTQMCAVSRHCGKRCRFYKRKMQEWDQNKILRMHARSARAMVISLMMTSIVEEVNKATVVSQVVEFSSLLEVLFLLHVKYLELWYPQYSGDLIKAEKTFAVYKNMNLNELRKTIQSALYMFDIKSWPDTGPSWVKSEDAQTIFPFSAVVTIPELFHNCADEGGEIKRFRLPDTIVTPLYMNNVPFVEFRRAWKSMSKDLFQSVENMMSWVMSNWLALVVVIAVSSEMLNIGFIIAGMEEWTGNVGMVILRRLLAGLSTMVTEPLRTLYRQGPSFNTAYGDVGFWSNRHLSDVCSSMMPRFDRSFWEDNMRKCEQEYDAREEGFVMIVVISFIFLGIYKIIPRLR